jgi:protein TonB
MYATYMRSWVAKVERVGNLNYPEQARRMNLDGALVLSVDLLSDGSVEQIRVLRSSGYDILDEAAVRIVRLSSPFAPLPEDISQDVDVLTITRTWQFSSQSGLY